MRKEKVRMRKGEWEMTEKEWWNLKEEEKGERMLWMKQESKDRERNNHVGLVGIGGINLFKW